MSKIKLFLCALFVLPFTACEKASEDEAGKDLTKKSELTVLDYETYDPEVEDPYNEMKDGIIAVFEGTNPTGKTAINRAIWLYEGAMSTLFTDTVFNDGDSTVKIERAVTFNLSDGGITA
ncbi:MAG: hypothetical protein U5L96_20535 [Owenweeksia sp.]|nr:hypothetical protein [Owenweeksia sp.]